MRRIGTLVLVLALFVSVVGSRSKLGASSLWPESQTADIFGSERDSDTKFPQFERFEKLEKMDCAPPATTSECNAEIDANENRRDEELLQIAHTILEAEGIHCKQSFVSIPMRPKSSVHRRVFAGRLERIVRHWEEFQVTTIEVESGQSRAYLNTFHNAVSCKAPVSKWTLADRTESDCCSAASH